MALVYDPDKDIFAKPTEYKPPDLSDPNALVNTVKNADDYIDPEKATVEGRVNNLLDKKNPLLQSVQADSRAVAGSMGLSNSTMATTAGTRGLIDKATQIATPDAATYASFGKNNQLAENQGKLNLQNAQLDTTKSSNNAMISGALTDQRFGNNQNAAVLKQKFDKTLLKMNLDSAERMNMANVMASQTNTLMNNVGSLLNNTDIEMGDNVSGWMSDFMYSNWDATSSLYNLDIKVT